MKLPLERYAQKLWYDRERPAAWLKPFAGLFGRAVALRRLAYSQGWKTADRLPVPVVVVGNLTVGGVGKTPLVIWLAEFLARVGYKPGVISRGYGGLPLNEPCRVDADSLPRYFGDEPVLIARRTGVPVYVFRQRAEAGRRLLAETDCDLLIADDGLQHYALARDVEIAVVDGERRFGNGALLPAGPLREPAERLDEADLVVARGRPQAGEYEMKLAGGEAVNLLDPTLRKLLTEFVGVPVHAVAGIGHPGRFFDDLRRAGLTVEGHVYPDHHAYEAADIDFGDESPVLMTEKDAVKCPGLAGEHHWVVPVSAELPAEFGEKLLQLLQVKRDGRKTA
ncbi:tetraacyldisaccharide 4'-kinase [Methylococcus sp. EFPC2]|uniref:tetraacyldisaccharide 4'-kinase n=1 Tax=Methylococcus sp. EFPC2 TaxID=2812648 RepID=UPI0019685543|nr:tetraacyldisaccharide 4'-kinase [Methylococcus sp. EFPC2]QSA97346.1 tetraacyldisaccharide 4'-kinase [Methylococcus sp. EFPC2]